MKAERQISCMEDCWSMIVMHAMHLNNITRFSSADIDWAGHVVPACRNRSTCATWQDNMALLCPQQQQTEQNVLDNNQHS